MATDDNIAPPRTAEPDARRLADALETLAEHRFVQIHNSTFRLMWYQFLRGLAFGFGTVIGASVLVSVVVLLLSQVEVIPYIGEFATDIIQEIESKQ